MPAAPCRWSGGGRLACEGVPGQVGVLQDSNLMWCRMVWISNASKFRLRTCRPAHQIMRHPRPRGQLTLSHLHRLTRTLTTPAESKRIHTCPRSPPGFRLFSAPLRSAWASSPQPLRLRAQSRRNTSGSAQESEDCTSNHGELGETCQVLSGSWI